LKQSSSRAFGKEPISHAAADVPGRLGDKIRHAGFLFDEAVRQMLAND
jgi:hypothetical protein